MIGSTAILAVMDSLFSEREFPSHRQSGSYPQERGSTGAAHAKRQPSAGLTSEHVARSRRNNGYTYECKGRHYNVRPRDPSKKG